MVVDDYGEWNLTPARAHGARNDTVGAWLNRMGAEA
jgi:hypothetical protein